MEFSETRTERGVTERRFDLQVGEELVPGLLWTPEGATTARPTVLIGHGGTQHKGVANVVSLARRLVRHLGYAAVAIDAPGHGDRVTDHEESDRARQNLQSRMGSGERGAGLKLSPEAARQFADRTRLGALEWQTVVTAVSELPEVGPGPFGYWGLSMGTAIGLPFVAAEPRISCAVLGLAGASNRPGSEAFLEAARSLTVPILFVFQWDDELMTRESGITLFDAIGSTRKTMHINPGGHVATPGFERDGYEAFYLRHLGRPSAT